MKRKYIFLIGLLVCAVYAFAEKRDTAPETDPVDLSIEENIETPKVPQKASNAIIRHMERIAKTFSSHHLDVRTCRKGEVIIVSIPSSDLFRANESELVPSAAKYLNAFNAIIRLPESYKVLILAHTDDSGSAEYADKLTEDRANAIDGYFVQAFPNIHLNIVPYGVGFDEPLKSNASITDRSANRRVEFYIIPEKHTIELARTSKL